MIINVYRSACKVPVVRVQLNLNFLEQIFKNTKLSNFVNIRPEGYEWFHPDGRTDITKLTGAFRNFSKAPKNKATIVVRHNTASPGIRLRNFSKRYSGHILRCLNSPEFFLVHLDN